MNQHFILIVFLFIFPVISAYSIDSLNIEAYLSQNNIEALEGPDGLYYSFGQKGNGITPQPGDYVKINYVGKLMNGNIFDQSESGNPFVFQLGYRVVIQGWEKGIPLMPVGTKGTLYVPPHLGYGKQGLGNIPPNTPLIFDLEIVDILTVQEYDEYMMEVERKEREAYVNHVKKQFKKDKKLIQEYAITNKIKAKRTPSGMSYKVTKKGKGDNAKFGDILEVHYEGFLMDGTLFDSSIEHDKTFQFVLGKRKVIKGWDEGLQHFNKGSEGWLLIPSKLAYGKMAINEDDINIPGDSALAFKIKVVDIKSPSKK